jgi:hypothetical protein
MIVLLPADGIMSHDTEGSTIRPAAMLQPLIAGENSTSSTSMVLMLALLLSLRIARLFWLAC